MAVSTVGLVVVYLAAALLCVARVRAAQRRNVRANDQAPRLAFGPVMVDLHRPEAQGPADPVPLTPLEYRVLECLARHSGMIAMQSQLLREVWGPGHLDDSRSLRVCIRNLRAKLEPLPHHPKYLVTAAGLGYRLRQD